MAKRKRRRKNEAHHHHTPEQEARLDAMAAKHGERLRELFRGDLDMLRARLVTGEWADEPEFNLALAVTLAGAAEYADPRHAVKGLPFLFLALQEQLIEMEVTPEEWLTIELLSDDQTRLQDLDPAAVARAEEKWAQLDHGRMAERRVELGDQSMLMIKEKPDDQ